jgi:cyclopropane-fatty-acyl-phospholipid synthase
MQKFLDHIFRRLVRVGRLTVVWPDGAQIDYGQRGAVPRAKFKIHDQRTIRRLVLNPSLGLGEGYMDGTITVDTENGDTVYDMLNLFLTNLELNPAGHPLLLFHERLATGLRKFMQYNPVNRSQRNVAHHYDLNGRLYSLFLDRDRQYSCGYFAHGDESLEEAQTAKKHHIAAKLRFDRPDLQVLDIGCGWGGMALTLARDYGAHVTGITLSQEQFTEARSRAKAAGLDDRVQFLLMDYRAIKGATFDRIVSVGMFEHVGIGHYQVFFDAVQRSLKPDGIALIHAIGRSSGPGSTNSWLRKYIFPGGYSPALSEVLPAVEQTGLKVTDLEILRLHYAETLRHWRRRFIANRDAIATLYDDRFCRMFEFYLMGSEIMFRHGDHMVWQMQLAHNHEAVPFTRDYLANSAVVNNAAILR